MKNDLSQDLKRLIAYIEAYQTKHSLSFTALLKRFPRLGSDRTFAKLKAGENEELNLEKWREDYSAVVRSMESFGANAADEVLFDDLTGIVSARRDVPKMLTTTGNDRFFLITGESGSGKTSILNLLSRKHGEKMITMQAVAGLTNSAFAFAGELLMAMGGSRTPDAVKKLPRNLALRLAELQEKLNRRVIVCIEEAHDLDPEAFKLIKLLINTTRAGFLLVAIPGIWTKLTRGVYDDVTQLTGNRNGGVLKLNIEDADTEKLLKRLCKTGEWEKRDMARATLALRESAKRHGGLKFIVNALHRAAADAAEASETVALHHIEAGIDAERTARGLRD